MSPDVLLIVSLYTVQIMALILLHNILTITILYAKSKAWLIKATPQFALEKLREYITCGPGTDTASPLP